MNEPEPQMGLPQRGSRTAVGAVERFPIVLVEATGALGVLVAEKILSDETLVKVLYFRSLMGKPYAKFFDKVELKRVDGIWVARAVNEDALFFEPSEIPYAITNLTEEQYDYFLDEVVSYRCESVEHLITSVFSSFEGFGLDETGKLQAPPDYADKMDSFLGPYAFAEPDEPRA